MLSFTAFAKYLNVRHVHNPEWSQVDPKTCVQFNNGSTCYYVLVDAEYFLWILYIYETQKSTQSPACNNFTSLTGHANWKGTLKR